MGPEAIDDAEQNDRDQDDRAAGNSTLRLRGRKDELRLLADSGFFGLELTRQLPAVQAEVLGIGTQEPQGVGRAGEQAVGLTGFRQYKGKFAYLAQS